MKKILLLFLTMLLVFSFTSCEDLDNPSFRPMTKWETSGFELYVTELGMGLLIADCEDGERYYDIKFLAPSVMMAFDIRSTDRENLYRNIGEVGDEYSQACWDMKNMYESKFTITAEEDNMFVKAGMIPQEVIFNLVATDLVLNDIPNIDRTEDGSMIDSE